MMNHPPWATGWQQQQYYRPPDPNVYLPAYNRPGYVDPRAFNEPPRWVSTKYPTLNPILASDSTLLRFDVRRKPRVDILASTYYSNAHIPATSTGVTYVRLISKSFPWAIDIKGDTAILCEAVWDALYVGLQKPIEDSEWGLIVGTKKQKETIEKAAKKRIETEPADDKRLKRIDFLGEAILFKGLDKDEEFEKLRLIPGDKGCSDTWVVKFA